MCRLFAYAAPQNGSATSQLGDAGMARMMALAQLHADGWGWSAVNGAEGAHPIVYKSAAPAGDGAAFSEILSQEAPAAMVHLRWATLGLPVKESNTHPFLMDGLSFEHNGSLKPISLVRSLLSDTSLNGLQGTTDSEMYFAMIRERFADGWSLEDATVLTAHLLRRHFPTSSLNSVLLSSETLIVVHSNAANRLAGEDLEEASQFELPAEHTEDYFALRWHRKSDGTVLVASSGLAESHWQAIPAETVMVVTLSDCSVRMIPITELALRTTETVG